MQSVVNELRIVVSDFASRLADIPEAEFSLKPTPNKWSKKEVTGHLIDSAQTNLRRFICGQYEVVPPKIVYDQDFWVASNGYQGMKKEDVIQFWKLINERIAKVLETMPLENQTKQIETSQLHTLKWLAEDYVRHMKHHLNQIIAGSFNIIYK
jgi:hypothetical protein